MSKQNNSKSLTLTIAISGAVLGYAFLVFMPIQRSIGALRGELDAKRLFILEAEKLKAEVVELEARLKQAQFVVERWQQNAPSDEDMSTLIGQVSVLASETGAVPGRITPRDPITLAALRRHPAELAVEGTYLQLTDFLRRLELLPKTVWISNLRLEPAGEDGETLRCEISFSVFADNSGDSD